MKSKYFLFLFSSIFLILSIILYFNIDPINPHKDIDSQAYIERGLKFATQNSLLENDLNQPPYFVVGYPFFVGLIYKVFGYNNFFIILIQILLSLLSGFLIFNLCMQIFNKKVALISFAFFSLNLGYLVFSQFILTEILLVFFLLLFLFQFLLFFKFKKILYLVSSCFILGFSVLVKPAALYFIPFVLLLIFFFTQSSKDKKAKYILIATICFYIPIISYMSFNKKFYGQFKVSDLDDVNLYLWYYPNVLAQKNGTDSNFEREKLESLVGNNRFNNDNWREIKYDFWMDFIRHPFVFAHVGFKNVAKTFLGLYLTNMKVLISNVKGGQISYFNGSGSFISKIYQYVEAGTESNWIIFIGFLELFWSLFRLTLVFIGLCYLFLKKRLDLFFVFVSFIFYFSLITGHDGCARFRMMFEFVLIILAALGFYVLLWRKFRDEKCLFCNFSRRAGTKTLAVK